MLWSEYDPQFAPGVGAAEAHQAVEEHVAVFFEELPARPRFVGRNDDEQSPASLALHRGQPAGDISV